MRISLTKPKERNTQMTDIAIIGGGASGIMSALAAASMCNVTIYESGDRLGKKILSTGNGRCNLSNANTSAKDYHGENPEFINGATKQFTVKDTLDFFNQLGVLTKEENDGKIYPYSNQASAVSDALRMELERQNVRIVKEFEVCKIKKKSNVFEIFSYDGKCETSKTVIIATGGKAAPATGSKGGGYELLKSMGHCITPLSPSLVQIKTPSEFVKKLKGIKLNAKVTLGNESSTGELLFTEYGLSGPPIFFLSAYLEKQKSLSVDIMPEYTQSQVEKMLFSRRNRLKNEPVETFLVGMLNKKVGQTIMKQIGISPLSRLGNTLTDKELHILASTIKNLCFDILGTMSWNNAQVTKGGVKTSEFNPVTLESNLVSGLFAAGEVFDIDGNCGGYNLQWAWSSGYTAGIYAAQKSFSS